MKLMDIVKYWLDYLLFGENKNIFIFKNSRKLSSRKYEIAPLGITA